MEVEGSPEVMFPRRGDYIGTSSVCEELEACVERRREKYFSDLRVMVTYLTQGFDGVGGAYVYRTLQDRYPDEYRELREITRKSLLIAEGSEDYEFVPEGYILDRSDPEILVLRRDDPDRTFVAVFSARGVTVQGILAAVKENRERRKEDSGQEEGA